jgi:shikimate kinase
LADRRSKHPTHIALVGLMGSGKTTVGQRLARRLGYRFVDADAALAERTGRSVRHWFAEEGEEAFREAETWVLADLLSAREPTVVATGGGVVTTKANRTRLAQPDVAVVWLRATPEFLASRIEQRQDGRKRRPLLDDDVAGTLERLAGERNGWYEKVADITIDVEPVHQHDDKPKKRLSQLVEEALRESGVVQAGAASGAR